MLAWIVVLFLAALAWLAQLVLPFLPRTVERCSNYLTGAPDAGKAAEILIEGSLQRVTTEGAELIGVPWNSQHSFSP